MPRARSASYPPSRRQPMALPSVTLTAPGHAPLDQEVLLDGRLLSRPSAGILMPRLKKVGHLPPPTQKPNPNPNHPPSSSAAADQSTAIFTRPNKRAAPGSPPPRDRNATSFAAFMAAHPRKRPHLTSRPNCTHVRMVKLYGGWHVCHLCGRQPTLGFIYACEQDHTLPLPLSPLGNGGGRTRGGVRPRSNSLRRILGLPFQSPTKDLESIGLSPWIIDAAAQGKYTKDQITTMAAQKAHVRNMIVADQAQHDQPSPTALVDKLSSLGLQHLAKDQTSAHETSSDDQKRFEFSTDSSKSRSASRSGNRSGGICDFKVCHTCRPISRDRVFVSVEAAIRGEVEMPRQWHPFTMPVADMHTMRSIGLKPSPVLSFEEEYELGLGSGSLSPLQHNNKVSETSLSSMAEEKVLKSHPSSIGFRSSLRKSLVELLHARRGLPMPNLGQPQQPSDPAQSDLKTYGSQDSMNEKSVALNAALAHLSLDDSISTLEADGSDIELWRALAEEQQKAAALTRLPGEDDTKEMLDLEEHHDNSGNNEMDMTEVAEGECLIRNGEHDAVGLGVTLTEEAVETRSPDFVISSV